MANVNPEFLKMTASETEGGLGRALLRVRDALNELNDLQRGEDDDIPSPTLSFNDFYHGEVGYELKPDENTGRWRVTYHPPPETFLLEW